MLAAGIVTYNPQVDNVVKLINTLCDICGAITIVDNGSDNVNVLKEEVAQFHDVKIIENGKNYGIAKALNQIMEEAKNLGYRWVLSLDQDSQLEQKLVNELYKGTKYDKVAIICPRIYDLNSEKIALKQEHHVSNCIPDFLEVDKCITSGAITSIEAWNAVDGYDEFLFIDSVDFDFCKRVKYKNYIIIESELATLKHKIGKTEYHKLFGINVGVMNHSAFRKYYMTRNRIYCNYKFNNRFGFENIVGILKTILIVMLYEEDKRNKIKSIIKGVYDGISAGKDLRKTFN